MELSWVAKTVSSTRFKGCCPTKCPTFSLCPIHFTTEGDRGKSGQFQGALEELMPRTKTMGNADAQGGCGIN